MEIGRDARAVERSKQAGRFSQQRNAHGSKGSGHSVKMRKWKERRNTCPKKIGAPTRYGTVQAAKWLGAIRAGQGAWGKALKDIKR